MPRATYMYLFDVQPERHAEFVAWARDRGVPFWLSRQGLLSYRTYRVQSGAGLSIGMAEFESQEALDRVLNSSTWSEILAEFQSCVNNLAFWVLEPGATGDEPLRPKQQLEGTSAISDWMMCNRA
jgi:hypothetical protein